MKPRQRAFLEGQLFSMTMQATAQRAGLYRPESDEAGRRAFRSDLEKQLKTLVKQYQSNLPEDQHLTNIEALANDLSSAHTETLNGGRFRIGTAQKALNLYLKYMWCMGWVAEPPHCPFDAIILAYVPECRDMRWTKLDSLEDYKRIVHFSKIVAGDRSLSEWELAVYNKDQPVMDDKPVDTMDKEQLRAFKKSMGIGRGTAIQRDGTRKNLDDE